jgi:hypothetical protein
MTSFSVSRGTSFSRIKSIRVWMKESFSRASYVYYMYIYVYIYMYKYFMYTHTHTHKHTHTHTKSIRVWMKESGVDERVKSE